MMKVKQVMDLYAFVCMELYISTKEERVLRTRCKERVATCTKAYTHTHKETEKEIVRGLKK